MVETAYFARGITIYYMNALCSMFWKRLEFAFTDLAASNTYSLTAAGLRDEARGKDLWLVKVIGGESDSISSISDIHTPRFNIFIIDILVRLSDR